MRIASSVDALNNLKSLLRRRYPTFTADRVAEDINVPAATARKWFSAYVMPNSIHLAALTAEYGPEVLGCFFVEPPEWLASATEASRNSQSPTANR